MTVRAIDMHVHLHTTPPDAAVQDAKQVFDTDAAMSGLVDYYRSRNLGGVVFDVDKETSTGQRIDNALVAKVAAESDGHLIGFASVDPHKGAAAIEELERCLELGLRGLKVQPVTQGFSVADPQFSELWSFCQTHGWPVMIHTGTTAIGAGSPGGRGFRLRYGHPSAVDDLAADFPDLQIIAAHFGWPWHLELLAIARHKGNVYVDLSGWSPKYIPAEVVQYLNSVIPEKFLFGTDYPWLKPDRWLEEFDKIQLKDGVREKVLFGNASRLLGWDA